MGQRDGPALGPARPPAQTRLDLPGEHTAHTQKRPAPTVGDDLDLVHVIGIAEQLAVPGTVFAERVFSARERREARRRSAATGSDEAEHLAARWAAKEAFVKAWSQALGVRAGRPVAPVVGSDDVDWREVEVVTDRWGR
ncbi:4'-phosphopantetheinyl transferase superfamily protein, partial [Actinomyces sp. oral taxon 448]|uniref:4'-phosphopantetheinyl transferase superfamily protein n=1 Tax=Actinomyces sp. oral taxon 448 TaxID=712124 RepID=UPI0025BD0C39